MIVSNTRKNAKSKNMKQYCMNTSTVFYKVYNYAYKVKPIDCDFFKYTNADFIATFFVTHGT